MEDPNRAKIVPSAELQRRLDREARSQSAQTRLDKAREFVARVEEGRANYAGMLSRVWKEAERTLEMIEQDDDMPTAKRVAALRDLSRLMPMLSKAEANHVARIGGVAVQDMSESQLEAEVRRIRRSRRRGG